mmetsp:Transcript_92127/g.298278  ORF Transcript_92127/g.298278 Transcript_92127/m.298278 type:complete len:307 (-) Transcript_92127:702-1622(-)
MLAYQCTEREVNGLHSGCQLVGFLGRRGRVEPGDKFLVVNLAILVAIHGREGARDRCVAHAEGLQDLLQLLPADDAIAVDVPLAELLYDALLQDGRGNVLQEAEQLEHGQEYGCLLGANGLADGELQRLRRPARTHKRLGGLHGSLRGLLLEVGAQGLHSGADVARTGLLAVAGCPRQPQLRDTPRELVATSLLVATLGITAPRVVLGTPAVVAAFSMPSVPSNADLRPVLCHWRWLGREFGQVETESILGVGLAHGRPEEGLLKDLADGWPQVLILAEHLVDQGRKVAGVHGVRVWDLIPHNLAG